MKLNIAVVQFAIEQFVPEHNLRKAEHFIQAAATRAHIIVFPEDFITGPINGEKRFADYQGRYIAHFQKLAATYSIDIVPGSFIEGDDADLYNTTYYIDKTGTIRGKYRKVNLWIPERDHITPGNQVPVFQTAHGKVGLMICWDLIFPEVFRSMVRQGVEIVICPSYWCFEDASVGLQHDAQSEIKLVNALCVARAFENEVVLVYANAAGAGKTKQEEEEHLIGQSQITVPFKGALTVLNHTQEEMFIQEVDLDILHDAEAAYQIRKDLKIGII